MGQRLDLQTKLEQILDSDSVYFQPPENLKMSFPAIVYGLSDVDTIHADNLPYRHVKRYQVTHIDRRPETTVFDALTNLPLCSFDRRFVIDGLNHNVFNIYF